MHDSSLIHCPNRMSIRGIVRCPVARRPENSKSAGGSFDCIVSSWSRVRVVPGIAFPPPFLFIVLWEPCSPLPLPLPLPKLLPFRPRGSFRGSSGGTTAANYTDQTPFRVYVLWYILVSAHVPISTLLAATHLTYNYVDDIVVYMLLFFCCCRRCFCFPSLQWGQQQCAPFLWAFWRCGLCIPYVIRAPSSCISQICLWAWLNFLHPVFYAKDIMHMVKFM